MLCRVRRKHNGKHACTGEFEIDGALEAFTLEDIVRDLGTDGHGKIMHETAIPAGKYRITLEYSPKFKKVLPYLHDVPFFTGILIHPLNTDKQTWGCIGVGDEIMSQTESIKPGTSTPAFERIFKKIEKAIGAGEEVWIEVVNEFPEGLRHDVTAYPV